jgi:hypothetical protein
VPEGSRKADPALDAKIHPGGLQDGAVPFGNNQIENLIRPWELGRLLLIYRAAAQRQTGGGAHEADPVGTHERT